MKFKEEVYYYATAESKPGTVSQFGAYPTRAEALIGLGHHNSKDYGKEWNLGLHIVRLYQYLNGQLVLVHTVQKT